MDGGAGLKDFIENKGLNYSETMMYVLRDGHHPDVPELNIIGKMFKKLRSPHDEMMARDYPDFKPFKGSVIELPPSLSKYNAMGKEKFVEFMKGTLDLPSYLGVTPQHLSSLSNAQLTEAVDNRLARQFDDILERGGRPTNCLLYTSPSPRD